MKLSPPPTIQITITLWAGTGRIKIVLFFFPFAVLFAFSQYQTPFANFGEYSNPYRGKEREKWRRVGSQPESYPYFQMISHLSSWNSLSHELWHNHGRSWQVSKFRWGNKIWSPILLYLRAASKYCTSTLFFPTALTLLSSIFGTLKACPIHTFTSNSWWYLNKILHCFPIEMGHF